MKIGTSDVSKLYVGSAEVDKVYLGTDLVYGGGGGHDYSQDYLTFEILSAGTITSYSGDSTHYYSLDGGQTWSTSGKTHTINVEAGDKVMWKSNPLNYLPEFSGTAYFNVEGNLLSMYYGDNFADKTTFGYAGMYPMFKGSNVVNAENLVLPTANPSNRYRSMFSGCTSLTNAPRILPATTLVTDCYQSMFYGCTSLTTAPELPATTLAQTCYQNMFKGCTSLTTAPELPATTMVNQCYSNMFSGCTSLTTAPELQATTLDASCYYYMFAGCTSLTTAPELPATTLANQCYNGMFYGCTSLTTAPELPATTLVTNCYSSMFNGCSSLSSITCLATDISATDCTARWVGWYNSPALPSTGTFTKAAGTSWSTGYNGIPKGWTVQDFQ